MRGDGVDGTFVVRPARPDEADAVGELTVEAYATDELVRSDSGYVHELRDAPRRMREAELLVAVEAENENDKILGSVTYCRGGTPYAEVAVPGEADFRMLAVAPWARGRRVGETLVRACLERARRDGCSVLRLSTAPAMHAAHRIYERLGFWRTPDLDWSPEFSLTLLTYALDVRSPGGSGGVQRSTRLATAGEEPASP